MGHLFQAECWAKHPSVGQFIMAKAMDKVLERQVAFLAHLFMKIIEIKRKGRAKVTSCM